MSGRWALQRLWPVLLLITACAKPKYVAPIAEPTEVTQNQAEPTCQAKFSSGECVAIVWKDMPNEASYGSFLIKIFRPNLADGSPVPETLDGEIAVVLWMPSMGHGSTQVTLTPVDVGTELATHVFFVMRGRWEIRIQLKAGNVVKDQAIIPISI